MKNWLLCLTIAVAGTAAQAEAPKLRFFGGVGYGLGGAPLLSEVYTNGQPFELDAGSGWVWTVGGDFRLTDKISVQGSIGHQRNRVVGSNFTFDFQRQPVELMGFYSVSEQVRVGVGARKVENAKLTGDGVAYGYPANGNYNSSVGAVLEAQYLFNVPSQVERNLVVGMNLRFVKESYTQADGGTPPYETKSGDHVALGLVFYY